MASPSDELQTAIYAALVADAGVGALVGDAIYDGRPPVLPDKCITFGPSDYVPDDMDCITGRQETVQIDCWWASNRRLKPVKTLADAVKAALHRAELPLGTHALAFLEVEEVRAFMDADGATGHGVVIVTAMVEER